MATVKTRITTRNLGSSDSASMQKLFPGSPIHSGEYTEDKVKELVQDYTDGIENQNPDFAEGVDMDYGNAPNLSEVEVGGAGLPGSSFGPNIAAPPQGMNPKDIPASGVESSEAAKGSGSPFPGDSLSSPDKTSKLVSGQKIGSLIKGKSSV
jgi:hypothetical protein